MWQFFQYFMVEIIKSPRLESIKRSKFCFCFLFYYFYSLILVTHPTFAPMFSTIITLKTTLFI